MDEEWLEKLDDYLNGAMSREAQLRFEAELEVNEQLAAVVRSYRIVEEELEKKGREYGEEDLLQISMRKFEKKYFGTAWQGDGVQAGKNGAAQALVRPAADMSVSGKGRGSFIMVSVWKKLAIAAIMVGVVAMGTVWFVQKKQDGGPVVFNDPKTDIKKSDTGSLKINISPDNTLKPDNDEIVQAPGRRNTPEQAKLYRTSKARLGALYAAYSKPDALPDQKAAALEEGDDSYEKGAFKEAIAGYEAVIASMEVNVRGQGETDKQIVFYAYYYRAQSYLVIDSVASAIPDLYKAVANSPDGYWKSKAQWYLAMALLKTGEVEKATVRLKQVSNSTNSGEYRQKAAEVLSLLDRENR